MTKVKRGSIVSIRVRDQLYTGIVLSGGRVLSLVVFDPVSNSLKSIKNVTSSCIEKDNLTYEDMPKILADEYDHLSVSIKKGSSVEFVVDDKTYQGVVVKGGNSIIVEFTMNGTLFRSKGSAKFYKVIDF